ncbi:MAG: hypothetical protein HYR56_10950 [Acidobacteria bacterium]|nr:hypothetical protein [Acidobacteriota bacterium]MBI3428301.1 hypothetical protein [Acidobacteriota bacterium]
MKNHPSATSTPSLPPGQPASAELSNTLRNWVMIALTAIFVLLYGAALLGWVKPLTDERMVARLEPILYVIIGYYFGRLPAQQNEQSLKAEIGRQTQIAEAAQHAKEQAQQTREALEEKVKNVRVSLTSSATTGAAVSLAATASEAAAPAQNEALRQRVALALNLLNS